MSFFSGLALSNPLEIELPMFKICPRCAAVMALAKKYLVAKNRNHLEISLPCCLVSLDLKFGLFSK